MVKSKARFSFKQYIRNEPTKWGFKLWCLCDSHNGNTNNFTIYCGKEGELLSHFGLSYDVVMNLASPYLNQGYKIYMDNYYTSQLLRDLHQQGTYGTGTVASNRKGLPKQIKELVSVYNDKPRGSGKDTKCVKVGSTEHPGHAEGLVTRNWKDKENKKQKKMYPYHFLLITIITLWVEWTFQIRC